MTPYIDIHTHKQNTVHKDDIIKIYSLRLGVDNHFPTVPFSAGIHPWDVSKEWDYEALFDQLNKMNIVAIGETGIDLHHNKENLSQQQYLFEKQLEIATNRGLPVIIHCVKAFEHIMSTLRGYNLPAVIFHGYTGSREQTLRIKGAGYYVSLGVTSLNSAKTINGLGNFPHDHIFFETDDSGKDIHDIYNSASSEFGISSDEIKRQTYENFKTIFRNT